MTEAQTNKQYPIIQLYVETWQLNDYIIPPNHWIHLLLRGFSNITVTSHGYMKESFHAYK